MRGSTAGLADCLLRGAPNNAYTHCLSLLDILISSVVIAPLAVAYWRGTWNMSLILIYPDDPVRAGYTCTILGMWGQFLFNYYQATFKRCLDPNKHRLCYYIASRMYTYIFGWCCILTWSGIWLLVAEYVTLESVPMGILTGIAFAALCLLRGLRNIFGVPFYMALDTPPDYFTVRTMYQKGVRKRKRGKKGWDGMGMRKPAWIGNYSSGKRIRGGCEEFRTCDLKSPGLTFKLDQSQDEQRERERERASGGQGRREGERGDESAEKAMANQMYSLIRELKSNWPLPPHTGRCGSHG